MPTILGGNSLVNFVIAMRISFVESDLWETKFDVHSIDKKILFKSPNPNQVLNKS